MYKIYRPRALFEADGGNGGGGDGGQGGGGQGGGDGADPKATELAKAQSEIARLGKLLNERAEADKAREAEEAKKQEEEAKKRGEFENLYGESTKKVEELTKSTESMSGAIKAYDEYFTTQVEDSMKKLDKEVRDAITPLLDGKSAFEKAKALPGILAVIGKSKGVGNNPPGGTSPGASDKSRELLEKGDVRGSLGVKLSGL